ncbi:MAG TPA: PPOX class F420-dependent oxidoreductase [Dehalococcoidia bacterium]
MATLTPGVRALFAGKNFGHLATVMPDGSPQVSVVWVDVEGDNILVNTAEGRVKPRNVRRDPRVAISIYNQEAPYQAAAVRGEVVEVRTEGALEGIHKLAKKYMGLDEYPNLRLGEQRLIFVIRPDRVAAMGIPE